MCVERWIGEVWGVDLRFYCLLSLLWLDVLGCGCARTEGVCNKLSIMFVCPLYVYVSVCVCVYIVLCVVSG